MIGIEKSFRVLDKNNSGMLNVHDFVQAVEQHGLGVSVQDLKQIFDIFENKKSGVTNYEAILNIIKGSGLSPMRLDLVNQAF